VKSSPPSLLLLVLPVLALAQVQPLNSPVENFRLPTFTKEGNRSMLLQGSQALVGTNEVELQGMTLTIFTGDAANTVETVILSPLATIRLDREQVQGESTVRVIRDDIEITGQGWSYDHGGKKVSITRNARIVFQAQLPDILK
jgi:hypothetical protein